MGYSFLLVQLAEVVAGDSGWPPGLLVVASSHSHICNTL